MSAFFYSLLVGALVLVGSYKQNIRLLDWMKFQSIGTRDHIVEKLNQMFIEVAPSRVLTYLLAGSFAVFFIVFLIFLPNVLGGIIFGSLAAVGAWKMPKPVIQFLLQRRMDLLSLQMVDGLNLMANAMKSGLSVPQAMGIVVEQSPQPLSQEFSLILSENKIGVSLEDALQNFAKRVPSEDVEMFVTSVVILKETGGNLAETFDTIVTTIRERVKVQNKIKSMTAQGYYQGMLLMAMPPLLGLYFSLSDPGFMDPFFKSPLGWIALSVVIVLEVGAYFAIRKVMKIDV